MSASPSVLGFVGLGNMGSPMAMRLLEAGFAVSVYDVRGDAAKPLGERGAHVARSPREVAGRAGIVLACLPSREASREAAFGPDGVAGGAAVRIYAELSTIGSATAREIAEALAVSDVDFVDAPVSGGVTSARDGTLTFLLAGPSKALSALEGVLEVLAGNVFVLGNEPGQAQVAKLVNNLLSISGMVTAMEGMVMGAKAGLDAQTLLDSINVSTGRNSATAEKFPAAILPRTFRYGGIMNISKKDMELIVEEADRLSVPLWVAPRILELYRRAADHGYGTRDSLRLIQFLEGLAGGAVVKSRDAPDDAELAAEPAHDPAKP